MVTGFLILGVCAAATVLSVHFLLVPGIESLCESLSLSEKTEGQIIGYATSVPEFVVVLSSALAGVKEAGFWNIASSNIINWILFLGAVTIYRQWRELKRTAFLDELTFGLVSVGIPVALLKFGVETTIPVCLFLLGFFVLYKLVDIRLNRRPVLHDKQEGEKCRGVLCSLGLMTLGAVIILVSGRILGKTAGELITRLSIAPWLVGWILGGITSIPELTSFIEIYALHKRRDTLHLFNDTQQALDALVASNMSNLGIILPVGMILYILVT